MNPFVQFIQKNLALDQSAIDLLEAKVSLKKYEAGEIILRENAVCANILFVVSGKARSFFTNHEGQEYTWNFHFNDADSSFENYFILDYHSFLTQTPTHLTFQAIEDLEVVALSYRNQQLLLANSTVMQTVSGKMTEMAYQNVHRRAFNLLTLNAKEKYLGLLANEPYLLNKFQHYLIASYLGIAPQSLSRLRKEISKG